MARERRPSSDREPTMPMHGKRWPRPPADLVRFVRALAVDDARRDHDAALDASRRSRTGGRDFHPNTYRSTGRR